MTANDLVTRIYLSNNMIDFVHVSSTWWFFCFEHPTVLLWDYNVNARKRSFLLRSGAYAQPNRKVPRCPGVRIKFRYRDKGPSYPP